MTPLFIQYPKCSTCKNALKFLKNGGITPTERDIVSDTPTKEELKSIIEKSGLDFKKFFNTSGMVYREMGLKDKVKEMSIDEAVELLSSNGMLIKRPILVTDNKVLVGFKQTQYDEILAGI